MAQLLCHGYKMFSISFSTMMLWSLGTHFFSNWRFATLYWAPKAFNLHHVYMFGKKHLLDLVMAALSHWFNCACWHHATTCTPARTRDNRLKFHQKEWQGMVCVGFWTIRVATLVPGVHPDFHSCVCSFHPWSIDLSCCQSQPQLL